ncbi:MAG: hypothetical protein M3Y24_09895 [Acidobacteriota bacterium]|nr:hypothetical protein [Acidobacteriota bacterium]
MDTASHPTGTIRQTNFNTNDHLFATQFGIRAIFRTGNRLTLGVGAGPAVLHYSTDAFGESFTKWGYYVLASAKFSFDRAGHSYVGSTPKLIGVTGRGYARYLVLGGEFGVRF